MTSPNHPNSNGKAESGVKIAKSLMLKCIQEGSDPYKAFLELRNTPRKDTNKSPFEMMFNRTGRTLVPNLIPKSRTPSGRKARKEQVKKNYDRKA